MKPILIIVLPVTIYLSMLFGCVSTTAEPIPKNNVMEVVFSEEHGNYNVTEFVNKKTGERFLITSRSYDSCSVIQIK